MKPTATLRHFLCLASSALLTTSFAHAQSTLYWDANAATALQTDGAGAWTTANQWWNGTTNTAWVSGSNAVLGYSGAGGAVTLAGTTTVGSLVFNPFTGTYTIGTAGAGNTITLNNGITHNSSGTATILSPLILGGDQTWSKNPVKPVCILDSHAMDSQLVKPSCFSDHKGILDLRQFGCNQGLKITENFIRQPRRLCVSLHS